MCLEFSVFCLYSVTVVNTQRKLAPLHSRFNQLMHTGPDNDYLGPGGGGVNFSQKSIGYSVPLYKNELGGNGSTGP